MPALVTVGIPGMRWLPPLALPLFLLWPMVWSCLWLARLLDSYRPVQAEKLRTAMQVFRELRGLAIDVDGAEGRRMHIRFR